MLPRLARTWTAWRCAALLLVLAVGCDGSPPDSTAATVSRGSAPKPGAPPPAAESGYSRDSNGRVVIPHPNPAILEPDVSSQVLEGIEQLNTALARQDLTPEQLSAEFGTLGRLYQVYSCMAAAEACYLNATELNPATTRWFYLLGTVQHSLSKFDLAIANFQTVTQRLPDDIPTRIRLGDLCFEQNQFERAKEQYEAALRIDQNSAPALFGLGRIALEGDQLERSRELLERTVEIDPEASAAFHKLGYAYRGLGELERAKECLEKGGAQRPLYADPLVDSLADLRRGWVRHLTRGNEHYLAGDIDNALIEFSLAVDKAPEEPLPRSNMASILVRKHRYREAQEHYEAALRFNPDYAKAHFNLGTLLAQGGRDEPAVAHYMRALAITPDAHEINFNLGQALRRLRRFEQAIPYYQSVTKKYPARDTGRACEVFCLIALERWSDAVTCIDKHFRDLPGDALLGHIQARLLAACPDPALRQPTVALSLSIRVKQAFSTQKALSADHVQTYAMALAATGDFAQAIQEQERVVAFLQSSGSNPELLKFATSLREEFQAGRSAKIPYPLCDANVWPHAVPTAELGPHSCPTCKAMTSTD